MSLRILAAASMAALVAAQSTTNLGFGRFSCSVQNGDLTFSGDNDLCIGLPAGGAGVEGDFKADYPTPVGASCFRQANAGFFCGIAGAACTADENCDAGRCQFFNGAATGTCQGGFGQFCGGQDQQCTGLLYCTTSGLVGTEGVQGIATCGGVGAFCLDFPSTNNVTADQAIANQYCQSNTCDLDTQQCIDAPIPPPGVSQRARARRSVSARGLCPASHSACAVGGSKSGFECIDTTSNLEQCGACASAGGVDCTALPGVEAVGCVAGQCEVWSCAEGFSWDAASASCQA